MLNRPIPKMLRPLRDVGEIKDTGYRIVMAREAKMTDEQINAIWRDNASMYKQARAIEAEVRAECEAARPISSRVAVFCARHQGAHATFTTTVTAIVQVPYCPGCEKEAADAEL